MRAKWRKKRVRRLKRKRRKTRARSSFQKRKVVAVFCDGPVIRFLD
ncbi:hypothetical protein H112_04248 [Trichophyton rubrum D6]|nr:hypothetical protein H100_04254 [Trichophyton rubrum MR850]EZF63192.1 hypothetical protein H104_04238 [Trichophyton rubrum CBS 289.86]KDB33746.1 hypothetical protein H112_04248 [Trichophyton rubrum D6]